MAEKIFSAFFASSAVPSRGRALPDSCARSVECEHAFRWEADPRDLTRLEVSVAGEAGDEALRAILEGDEGLAAHRLRDDDARLPECPAGGRREHQGPRRH